MMKLVFEKVPDSQDSSFGFFHAGGRVFDCPYHFHPEMEFLHIVRGHGMMIVGDHADRFEEGDLFLLGEGLPHMFVADEYSENSDKRTHIRYVQFNPRIFGDHFWQLPENRTIKRFFQTAQRGLKFQSPSSCEIIDSVNRTWNTRDSVKIWSLMETFDVLAREACSVPLASIGYAPATNHRDSERLDRVIRYINSNITTEIAVSRAAQIAGLSIPAFSRFFSKYMTLPFVRYVSMLRIGLACRKLLETDLSISTICYECGFENLSNFNRQFLKIKGVAPRHFRSRTGVCSKVVNEN